MISRLRSGILASLLLGVFLGFVVVPRGAQAFAPKPVVPSKNPERFNVALASESEGASSAEDASTPPPKPVKCPDCDQCDGSGRYEE